MTLDPTGQPPSEDQGSKPQPPATQPGAAGPLDGLKPSISGISIEQLEASDPALLAEILSAALGNLQLVNQFADCLSPLFEDPGQEAVAVQDRLCRAVASQLRDLVRDDLFDNVEKLRHLSLIVDTIFLSCEDNPRGDYCEGLQELLLAQVFVLSELDSDRGTILDENHRAAFGDALPPTAQGDWMGLYLHGIEQIKLGFNLPGFEPSDELLDECRELVLAQFSWIEAGIGPTNSRTSFEAQLWSETLGLARMVVDESLEKPLQEITETLVRWFDSGGWDSSQVPIREDRHAENEILKTIGWLEIAEHRAMAALLLAQSGCGVESTWKEILGTRTLASRAGRIAIHGLAKSDATETAQYVSKLMNRIGSEKCPPTLAARYLDTLILLAAEPAMPQVIKGTWSPDAEYPLDPLRKELLLSRVGERLRAHDMYFESAWAKIQEHGGNPWMRKKIEKSASKRGVIWSRRALATLQSLGD